jgi:hypothetical protein
LEVRSSEL